MQAAFVSDLTNQCRVVYQNGDFAAGGMQQGLATAAHHDLAIRHLNIAAVDYLRRQQYHAILGIDGTLVFHPSGTITAKRISTSEEILIGHIQGRDH